jgi:hypothetical protein
MVTWQRFASEHPLLAQRGAERLFQFGAGFALLAILREGEPARPQAVCPTIYEGRLYAAISSSKRLGRRQRLRYALRAYPLPYSPQITMSEFFLVGRAVQPRDPTRRRRVLGELAREPMVGEFFCELLVEWSAYSWAVQLPGGGFKTRHLCWPATRPD